VLVGQSGLLDMKKMFKNYGIAVVAMGAMLVSASASAYTVTVGGTAVDKEGYTTSVVGATVIDFNSGSLPAGYVGGAVVTGSSPGNWATPPGDETAYLTVGPGSGQSSPATLTLGSLNQYFGFFGGSPDGYNSLELYNGSTLVGSFSGDELYTFAFGTSTNPTGDQSQGAYWNIWADNASEYFDRVVFISTRNAFETDNHATLAAVPVPAAAWLFVSGILGLMGFSSRRKAA
jgi:hypothetical protein